MKSFSSSNGAADLILSLSGEYFNAPAEVYDEISWVDQASRNYAETTGKNHKGVGNIVTKKVQNWFYFIRIEKPYCGSN